MEEVDSKLARKLYGRILEENLDEIVGRFPTCICRGRCVCHVTTEPKRIYIGEIRKNYGIYCREKENKQ